MLDTKPIQDNLWNFLRSSITHTLYYQQNTHFIVIDKKKQFSFRFKETWEIDSDSWGERAMDIERDAWLILHSLAFLSYTQRLLHENNTLSGTWYLVRHAKTILTAVLDPLVHIVEHAFVYRSTTLFTTSLVSSHRNKISMVSLVLVIINGIILHLES